MNSAPLFDHFPTYIRRLEQVKWRLKRNMKIRAIYVFVLSTSRSTSRIRQKNIHNEREYGTGAFSFTDERTPFTKIAPPPPPPPPFLFNQNSLYFFLIKPILPGYTSSMWNRLVQFPPIQGGASSPSTTPVVGIVFHVFLDRNKKKGGGEGKVYSRPFDS